MSESVKIVIPCRDEGEWLKRTVDSVLENTTYQPYEVVIVANGDRFTDLSFLRDTRYECLLARIETPLGIGRSVNLATGPGDARFYVVLDGHCLVAQPNWIECLIDCWKAHPNACLIQPEIAQFSAVGLRDPIDAAGLARTASRFMYSSSWAWPYDNIHDVVRVERRPSSPAPYDCMAGCGGAAFLPADAFHSLGGFEREVGGWSPHLMDYCIRGWLRGYSVVAEPRVRVLHRLRSGDHAFTKHYFHVVHGVLRTAFKYLSPRRRDLATRLYRLHGLESEVNEASERIRRGDWLRERISHSKDRVRTDDWLFSRFDVYEQRHGVDTQTRTGPPR